MLSPQWKFDLVGRTSKGLESSFHNSYRKSFDEWTSVRCGAGEGTREGEKPREDAACNLRREIMVSKFTQCQGIGLEGLNRLTNRDSQATERWRRLILFRRSRISSMPSEGEVTGGPRRVGFQMCGAWHIVGANRTHLFRVHAACSSRRRRIRRADNLCLIASAY